MLAYYMYCSYLVCSKFGRVYSLQLAQRRPGVLLGQEPSSFRSTKEDQIKMIPLKHLCQVSIFRAFEAEAMHNSLHAPESFTVGKMHDFSLP